MYVKDSKEKVPGMHFREIRASFFVFKLKNILSARIKKQKGNFRSHLDLPRVTFKLFINKGQNY